MSWLRLMEESLKKQESETEHLTQDTDASTATEKENILPQRHKYRVAKLIKEMWPAYLIEIIVIILGITITLALEAWRDKMNEREIEHIYIQNLIADLHTDQADIKATIARTDSILFACKRLINYLNNETLHPISKQEVLSDVQKILGRPKFLSSDVTFSNLKGSGNLAIIHDIELKNALFSFYNETQHIKENQNAEQQTVIVISGNYFLKNFPLGSNSDQMVSIPTDFEFRNHVLLRFENRNELMQLYKNAGKIAGQLETLLEKNR